MKKNVFLIVLFSLAVSCHNTYKSTATAAINQPPPYLLGDFEDDYGIEYTITENEFILKPSTRFTILEWNIDKQYFIAQNNVENETAAGLFTRIDYMDFTDMEPYIWGFCMSTYDAVSQAEAAKVVIADRNNPKEGCNGFPFSRMRPIN